MTQTARHDSEYFCDYDGGMKSVFTLMIFMYGCADVTTSGRKVHLIESQGSLLDFDQQATELSAKYNCQPKGLVESNTSIFPPSYSVHENEIHAALRNRGAKVGANVVIANFDRKPAQGVGLLCPESFFQQVFVE